MCHEVLCDARAHRAERSAGATNCGTKKYFEWVAQRVTREKCVTIKRRRRCRPVIIRPKFIVHTAIVNTTDENTVTRTRSDSGQLPMLHPLILLFALLPTARASSCFGSSNKSGNYVLDWRAEGTSFFDDENFEFDLDDYNNGASQYVNRSTALDEKLVQAHGSHSVVRVGAANKTATTYQRKTVKLETRKSWTYFLAVMRYTQVPNLCGVWPAFWTHAEGNVWPRGGEIDLLEYPNDSAGKSSFHTGDTRTCR